MTENSIEIEIAGDGTFYNPYRILVGAAQKPPPKKPSVAAALRLAEELRITGPEIGESGGITS